MSKRSHKTLNIDILEYLPYKNNIKLNKNILLPKIKIEYNLKNNIKISNILFNNNKNNDNRKSKSTKNNLFLTIPKEEEKNSINNLEQKENSEKELIKNLLSKKITISNDPSFLDRQRKLFKRNLILKKYMREAILYRKSIFQKNKISVGKIFKPFSFDNNNGEEFSLNKKSVETSFQSKNMRIGKKIKKFKTLDKNVELKKTIDDLKSSLRKKINCNLRYKFNKNKIKMNEVNSEINHIEKKIKLSFEVYRKNANDDMHKIYHHTDNIHSL